jgi:hypothetical protein
MATARYHRDQAELCLDIARLLSDRNASDTLRASAVRHFEQAIELEKRDQRSVRTNEPRTTVLREVAPSAGDRPAALEQPKEPRAH